MSGYKNILLTTDLSSDSSCASDYAVELARRFDGKIQMLYVFQDEVQYLYASGYVGPYALDWVGDARKDQQAKLERIASALRDSGKVPVETVFREGYAADAIVAYIKHSKPDCVVMATHGRKGLSHVVFGSVAERVLQHSAAPVLLIKPGSPRHIGDFKTIVVTTDFSPNADTARPYATELARKYGAKIHLVHVFETPIVYSEPGGEIATGAFQKMIDGERVAREEALCKYGLQFEPGDVQAAKLLLDGRAADKVCDYARSVNADFILIATHGRTGVPHFLLGSVAERVARMAPCAVLSIKPPEMAKTPRGSKKAARQAASV